MRGKLYLTSCENWRCKLWVRKLQFLLASILQQNSPPVLLVSTCANTLAMVKRPKLGAVVVLGETDHATTEKLTSCLDRRGPIAGVVCCVGFLHLICLHRRAQRVSCLLYCFRSIGGCFFLLLFFKCLVKTVYIFY